MELEFEIKVLKISKNTLRPLQISIGENIPWKFGERERALRKTHMQDSGKEKHDYTKGYLQ